MTIVLFNYIIIWNTRKNFFCFYSFNDWENGKTISKLILNSFKVLLLNKVIWKSVNTWMPSDKSHAFEWLVAPHSKAYPKSEGIGKIIAFI